MNRQLRSTSTWLIILLGMVLAVSSCKKDNTPDNNTSDKLEFVSLAVEKDTIVVQDVTKVTATVKGTNLTYSWACDNELGIIEGTGSEILFTICHAGKFKITCTVKDASNNQVSKDAYVTTIE